MYMCVYMYVCDIIYAHINISQIYICIMALVMFSKSLIIINKNTKYKSINVLKCSNIKENICE